MRGALWLALLMVTGVVAQGGSEVSKTTPVQDGPQLVLLVHHPFPDRSDPLGVPFEDTRTDAYWHRYRHLDTDGTPGFDFPHVVFDGVVPIEGLPDGDGPYVATKAAYDDAFQARAGQDTPIDLQVHYWRPLPQSAAATIHVDSSVTLQGDDLRLWAAIVEDPVDYAPPPALSNGVTIHPFVVRGVQDLGPLAIGQSDVHFTPADDWVMENTRIIAWVQQGASDGLRFDAHEVVQATIDASGDGLATATVGKVVLMEMYSATWCDTCLVGDKVAEEMAVDHGLSRGTVIESGYLVDGPWVWVLPVAILVGVMVARMQMPGGRP